MYKFSILLLALSIACPLAAQSNTPRQSSPYSKKVRLAQANTAKSKAYKEHIRKRIEESWQTYNINGTTAKVLVKLSKTGSIESTKLVKFTGDRLDASKTLEAIKYATPFGSLPGSSSTVSLLVRFDRKRVSIDNGRGSTASTTKTAKSKVVKRPHKVEIVRSRYSSKKTFNTKQEAKDLLDYLSN